jgi:hypothetical protein
LGTALIAVTSYGNTQIHTNGTARNVDIWRIFAPIVRKIGKIVRTMKKEYENGKNEKNIKNIRKSLSET